MYLVTALLERTGPPGPATWTAWELARRLRSSCAAERARRPRADEPVPVHLYATPHPGRTVRAVLYMEDSDSCHAELSALDFLLAALAAHPGCRGWYLAALGLQEAHRPPEPKGPEPPCHGSTPPCP
ncbi:hypothetical protein ABT160_07855 [Streptomyces sp. NPDC001941]|uniref:hypothetical protein n=1 Tax=Streptomyces sp. NPDC001941 TaxID=3154659 RepID=UPI00331D0DC3